MICSDLDCEDNSDIMSDNDEESDHEKLFKDIKKINGSSKR